MARGPQAAAPTVTGAALSIRNLFLLGRFEPARAQRDYQWEDVHWADLLSDFESAFRYAGLDADAPRRPKDEDESIGVAGTTTKEPVAKGRAPRKLPTPAAVSHYYLGHVLLLPRPNAGQFLIYDGQQRLTTLTLLLCALRDAAGDGDWLKIQQVLRTPPPANEARLTVGGRALSRIVDQLHGTKAPVGLGAYAPAERRMYEAAGFFLERIKKWSEKKRRDFADFMLDNVFATVTQMHDRRVAEYAYITINTRGKALENKDIIKGHFNQLAARHSLGAADEMSQQWAKLERAAGRRLDEILRLAFLLDYRRPATFDFGAQLMDYFAEENQTADINDWVGVRLPALIKMHKTMILDLSKENVLNQPRASIRRMTFLPWNYWQALLLAFAERDVKAPQRFAKSVAALEKWCFLINLVDVDDDMIVSIVLDALAQIDDGADPFGPGGELRMSKSWRDRARSRVMDGQITDVKRRGAHVRWLETLYWPATAVNFEATNDSSVEHVLPRSASGQWVQDFPQAIHIATEQFGNLCLVPKGVNADLGNQQYSGKRPAYLALAPIYKSAKDVGKAKAWTMAQVQARTNDLAQKAIPALGL